MFGSDRIKFSTLMLFCAKCDDDGDNKKGINERGGIVSARSLAGWRLILLLQCISDTAVNAAQPSQC